MLISIVAVAFVFDVLLALGLCKAAKRGDEWLVCCGPDPEPGQFDESPRTARTGDHNLQSRQIPFRKAS